MCVSSKITAETPSVQQKMINTVKFTNYGGRGKAQTAPTAIDLT